MPGALFAPRLGDQSSIQQGGDRAVGTDAPYRLYITLGDGLPIRHDRERLQCRPREFDWSVEPQHLLHVRGRFWVGDQVQLLTGPLDHQPEGWVVAKESQRVLDIGSRHLQYPRSGLNIKRGDARM